MMYELRTGMVFFEDVHTLEGNLLISRGQDVNEMLTRRLRNYASTAKVREPIRVIALLD
ncbi:MAG: hypothetical protein GY793_01360 [Proteobacteria bacterium]|nr:hypothetical protein [Pseudomonadota bacterium]